MATTVLGLVLANQRVVPSERIAEFSEDIGHVVLGTLFVTLGALVDLDAVRDVLPRALPLVLLLVFVVRPLSVWLSTVGSDIARNDRLYLAAMAPRGIVAAAVATVFANTYLEETGTPLPQLVPIVFTVVIGTVIIYGLLAVPLARWFRVAKPAPTGIAIVSNQDAAVELADRLAAADTQVMLITTSHMTRRSALGRGLLTYDGALEDEQLELALDGLGMGQAVLFTDDVNLGGHATHALTEHLGRSNIYQVRSQAEGHSYLKPAFSQITFEELTDPTASYSLVEAEELTARQTPLFLIRNRRATILNGSAPSSGQLIVANKPRSGDQVSSANASTAAVSPATNTMQPGESVDSGPA